MNTIGVTLTSGPTITPNTSGNKENPNPNRLPKLPQHDGETGVGGQGSSNVKVATMSIQPVNRFSEKPDGEIHDEKIENNTETEVVDRTT